MFNLIPLYKQFVPKMSPRSLPQWGERRLLLYFHLSFFVFKVPHRGNHLSFTFALRVSRWGIRTVAVTEFLWYWGWIHPGKVFIYTGRKHRLHSSTTLRESVSCCGAVSVGGRSSVVLIGPHPTFLCPCSIPFYLLYLFFLLVIELVVLECRRW